MHEYPNIENLDKCPRCNSSWKGQKIPDEYKDMYGKHTHYSRLIGIEDPQAYDGVLWWRCPDCKVTFHRFTGQEISFRYKETS